MFQSDPNLRVARGRKASCTPRTFYREYCGKLGKPPQSYRLGACKRLERRGLGVACRKAAKKTEGEGKAREVVLVVAAWRHECQLPNFMDLRAKDATRSCGVKRTLAFPCLQRLFQTRRSISGN